MINTDLIATKYLEMKKNDICNDYLDLKAFGELMIFINQKPEITMIHLEINEDHVYIGSNDYKNDK